MMEAIYNMRIGKVSGFAVCVFVCATTATFAQIDHESREVPHLKIARQLVSELQHDAMVNEYGSKPTFLRWGNPTREARTVCATFVTRLFEHTYGWKDKEIKHWLGASGADASEWHDAIVHEEGFRRVKKIENVHPGDILAVKYNDGSTDTGHVMIVDQEPEHIEATSPVEQDTEQYRVDVIDSSASGHGPTDTRYTEGSFTGGIGKGTIRLYANAAGRIIGYAWSETSKSKFYRSPARDLVVGRLTRAKEEQSSNLFHIHQVQSSKARTIDESQELLLIRLTAG